MQTPLEEARTLLKTQSERWAKFTDEVEVFSPPTDSAVKRLRELLPDRPFIISKERAATLERELGWTGKELLIHLSAMAKPYAAPPISKYWVGEAAIGKSGDFYLGVNFELPQHPLFQTVHGEQFLVAQLLLARGETGADLFAMPAAPCGHCRQFLWELNGAKDIRLIFGMPPKFEWLAQIPLSFLLPFPFGPEDLGVKGGGLLAQPRHALDFESGTQFASHDAETLAKSALEAAKQSYHPYSGPAGVAVQTTSGKIFLGPYIDNASFNAALPSLQVALVGLLMAGEPFTSISQAALVERKTDLKGQFQHLASTLATLAPKARVSRYFIENIES